MQLVDSLYPYPVLSVDDDDYLADQAYFDVKYSLDPATSAHNAALRIQFVLENISFERLLQKGLAAYYVQVECRRTMYRKIFKLPLGKNSFVLKIDPNLMRQRVDVTPLFLVTGDLVGYRNSAVNPELYGNNYVFPDLSVGDPLAIAFTKSLDIEDTNNFTKISSIIKVTESKSAEVASVDLDQDVILIKMPSRQYKFYVQSQSYGFGDTMLNGIILPALVYVLDEMISGDTIDETSQWHQVIATKCEKLGHPLEAVAANADISTVELAQLILNNPMENMINELKGVLND
ncbi:hypothetical protein OCH80_09090 [Lactobacillus sp. 23-2]|uniref:hypothetical protein n=1 Tax=Lactobacillus sp. 23-2 TaxID=2981842 RepID=UPI003837F097